MANHTYIGSVSNMRALSQSLVQQGIFDGALTICPKGIYRDGSTSDACVLLNETSAAFGDFELACQNATVGSFLSNKTAKLEAAENRTVELAGEGFTFVADSDGKVKGPLALSHDTELSLERISRVVGNGTAVYPQLLLTLDGRGFTVASDLDVSLCGKALDERGVYLMGDQVNGDGSSGEAALTIAIITAVDQAALDLITDTRI